MWRTIEAVARIKDEQQRQPYRKRVALLHQQLKIIQREHHSPQRAQRQHIYQQTKSLLHQILCAQREISIQFGENVKHCTSMDYTRNNNGLAAP